MLARAGASPSRGARGWGLLAERARVARLVNWSIGQKPKAPGLLGFADDNWLNGTQSGVFSFVYPDAVAAGYGLITTMIHDYGHHDGLDPVSGVDFEPTGNTFFGWLGDESNSMMSYIDLNWDSARSTATPRRATTPRATRRSRTSSRQASWGKPAAAGKLAEADTALSPVLPFEVHHGEGLREGLSPIRR